MPTRTGADPSASYSARLALVVSSWAAQLIRPPSQVHRAAGARRFSRNVLTTAVIAATLVAALIIWVDAREIALMPPRGAPDLWPFRILTDFGKDAYVMLLVTFLLVAVALTAPAMHGPTRRWLLTTGLRLQFIWLSLAVPLAFGELVKWIAGRGRPFAGGEANPYNFVPFAGTAAHASFPSAHSITAFALAFAIAALWPRMRGVMAAYALVIVFTRLVLLAHHPSDVVAGAAIGMIGAMCVRYWFAARSLGFVVGEAGIISPLAEGPLKKVAAKPSAS